MTGRAQHDSQVIERFNQHGINVDQRWDQRRSIRISKSSSSRRVTRLVPVFILETDSRTNYQMFAKARPDG